MRVFWVFVLFSLLTSAVYVFNDIRDVAFDQLHPEKRHRPLASGAISKTQAYLLFIGLTLAAILMQAFIFNMASIWWLMGLYLLMNLSYSVALKHVAILDVIIVALGFLVRLYLGSKASGIVLSHWIIIMTFLGAIFLAFAKRRDDLTLQENMGIKARQNLDGYNFEFVNAAIIISAAVVIVAYIMYATSSEIIQRNGPWVFSTALFVIIGILKYLQIIFVFQKSGNPTKIFLQDTFLLINLLAWFLSFGLIIYFK